MSAPTVSETPHDPQVDTSYTGIIASLREELATLRREREAMVREVREYVEQDICHCYNLMTGEAGKGCKPNSICNRCRLLAVLAGEFHLQPESVIDLVEKLRKEVPADLPDDWSCIVSAGDIRALLSRISDGAP